MVQRHVFDELDTENLHAFVVWGPMLGEEERADAVEATRFLEDRRSTHFWTPLHELADALAPVAGITEEGEPAWDTFLLFPPGATWGEEPPQPTLVHHVGKPLPDDQRLHGPTMRREIERLMAEAVESPGNAEPPPASLPGDDDPQDEAGLAPASGGTEGAARSTPAPRAAAETEPTASDRPYR